MQGASEIQADLDAIHAASLPYRVGTFLESTGEHVAIADARGHVVLWSEEAPGDPSEAADDRARRVVAALNAHDDLLAAIELAISYLEDGAPQTALERLRDALEPGE